MKPNTALAEPSLAYGGQRKVSLPADPLVRELHTAVDRIPHTTKEMYFSQTVDYNSKLTEKLSPTDMNRDSKVHIVDYAKSKKSVPAAPRYTKLQTRNLLSATPAPDMNKGYGHSHLT